MKLNVGGRDRINRLVVGVSLMAYAVYANEPMAYAGIIPLMTGIIGFCPLYPLFKFSTYK
jgi:hypothetical protein